VTSKCGENNALYWALAGTRGKIFTKYGILQNVGILDQDYIASFLGILSSFDSYIH
jgi:hypothetical protein